MGCNNILKYLEGVIYMKKILFFLFFIILIIAFILFNELKTYTLTFNTTGGDIIEPIDGLSSGEIVKLPTPTKEYFEFVYWYRFVDQSIIIVNNGTQVYDNWHLYAKWDKKKYQVRFIDDKGMIFDIQTVTHGEDAIEPEIIKNFEEFVSWDKEFKNVTTDLEVKAIYEYETYKVEFLDFEDKVIKTEHIEYGNNATPPVLDERLGYTFVGWDKTITDIKENIIVKPLYEINKYKVYFKKDGLIIDIQEVEHGKSATPPFNIDKDGFTFTGWDIKFTDVTNELIVNANYEINKYTVKFLDYENAVLQEHVIEHGNPATCPTLQERMGYTFLSWSHEFDNITKDLEITPIYQINEYIVKFINYDGDVVKTQKINYNQTATSPLLQTRKGYTFIGWDKEFSEITENLDVYAIYEINKYNVKFFDFDKNEITCEVVEYSKGATPPILDDKEGYTFIGWDQEFDFITKDIEVNPIYKKNIYKVTFINDDNSTLDMQFIEHGTSATAPASPIKLYHVFQKWDQDFSNITSDLIVKAIYISNDESINVLKFEIIDKEAHIIGINTEDLINFVIPDTYLGYKITKIRDYAFRNSNLESIVLGEFIEEIGEGAFLNCTSLKYIKLPTSLSIIDKYAFMSCTLLKGIVIPEAVYIINEKAFYGCTSLTIYIEASEFLKTWELSNPDNRPVILDFK